MKTNKGPTVKKSVRIPRDVVSELQKEAEKKFGGNFSDAAIYRMSNFKAPLTPAIMSKIQNITNKSVEVVRNVDSQRVDEIQKEVDALWNYLK